MPLRNAFENLSTELTLAAVLQRLQSTLSVAVSNWPAVQASDVVDRAARLLGRVTVDNFPAVQQVAGTVTANTGLTPLTDAQLRAARVAVDNGQAQALTDAQLRASAVPTAVTNFPAVQSTDVVDRAARQVGAVRLGTPGQLAAGHEATAYPGQRSLRVSPEPSTLLAETFDSSGIDTQRWTVSGTGVAASSGPWLNIEPGTAANVRGWLTSAGTFFAEADAWVRLSTTVTIGSAVISGCYRFFGFGTAPATPTTTAPITNGVGFEVRTDGTLHAVVWQGSARAWSQQLTRPTDGAWHRYLVLTKGTTSLFFFDDLEVPVAVASVITPGIQAMPTLMLSVNGTSALTAAPTFRVGHVTVGDTGRNNQTISDAVYPHRQTRVDDAGGLHVATAGRRSSTVTQTRVTVGTSSVLLVPANPNRLSLTIQHYDTSRDVCINYGSTASTTTGLRLRGATLTEEHYTGAIYARSTEDTWSIICVEVSL